MKADIDTDIIEKSGRKRNIPLILDGGLEVLVDTVKDVKPLRILEIGTAIGYSGIIMLGSSPDGCVLDTIEIDPDRRNEAIVNFEKAGYSGRVNSYLGDCVELLPAVIRNNLYDIIFIDASKSKYLECLQAVENNLSVKGVVIADNVYFRGMVESPSEPPRRYRALVKALRRFLEYIRGNERFDTVIHDKGDGVAVIRIKGRTD